MATAFMPAAQGQRTHSARTEINKIYEDALWRCEDCGLQDTNSHLLWCSGYENLRDGKDLDDDKQLCDYLQKIFLLRNEKPLNWMGC